MDKAAVIQIDSADHTVFIVGKVHLSVDETRLVLVNFHACTDQTVVIASGHFQNNLLVGNMGQDQLHRHTP